MRKIYYILIIFLWVLVSCSDDILDIQPKDRISESAVWNDEKLINAYLNSLYNCIPHGFKIHMQSKVTDEAFCSISWDVGMIPSGAIGPDNIFVVSDEWWNGGGNVYYWNRAWRYIRKINIFLDKMKNLSIEIDNKPRLIAEARFLRAYIYFELIKRFGGMPILTDVYGLEDAINGNVNLQRKSFDECVNFIDNELKEAIPDLPEKYAANDANFGRATKDVCRALRSRLWLYAASPLWNPTHDNTKWQKAADAAYELLNRGYSLYPDYAKLFNQPSGTPNNELIWARTFSASNWHSAPMHNLGRRYGAYGGW